MSDSNRPTQGNPAGGNPGLSGLASDLASKSSPSQPLPLPMQAPMLQPRPAPAQRQAPALAPRQPLAPGMQAGVGPTQQGTAPQGPTQQGAAPLAPTQGGFQAGGGPMQLGATSQPQTFGPGPGPSPPPLPPPSGRGPLQQGLQAPTQTLAAPLPRQGGLAPPYPPPQHLGPLQQGRQQLAPTGPPIMQQPPPQGTLQPPVHVHQPLFGLAADLAGSTPADPYATEAPQQAVRAGPRSNTVPVAASNILGIRKPLTDTYPRGLPPSSRLTGEPPGPYGLAKELMDAGGGEANPLATSALPLAAGRSRSDTDNGDKRRRVVSDQNHSQPQQLHQQQLREAGWQGPPIYQVPGAVGAVSPDLPVRQPGSSHSPPIPAGSGYPGVGGTEPDYGFVRELRELGPADPTLVKDFGLAAEVTRRRGGGLSPNGRVPRTRKRLAAVGGPAEFGLDEELARRQAQGAMPDRDPFNETNRSSNGDPFSMAGYLASFPTAPYDVPDQRDQEFVEGRVPIKIPGLGPARSETSAISCDEEMYGMAHELGAQGANMPAEIGPGGVDPEGRATVVAPPVVEWQPRGYKLAYDEDTGMLKTIGLAESRPQRNTQEYIEDVATGDFYRLNDTGLWHRFKRCCGSDKKKSKGRADPEDEEDFFHTTGGFRGWFRRFVTRVASFFSIIGIFIQGLLGGYAIMTFALIFLFYSSSDDRKYLHFYAALGFSYSRTFYTLIVLSIIAATARMARDQMRNWGPRRNGLRLVHPTQIVLYLVAYIVTLLCVPNDDYLTYEYNRNPYFFDLSFNSEFEKRLAVSLALNGLRTVCCGLAFLLLCYMYSLRVFMNLVRYEAVRRIRLSEASRPHVSPSLSMADAAQARLLLEGNFSRMSTDGTRITQLSVTAAAGKRGRPSSSTLHGSSSTFREGGSPPLDMAGTSRRNTRDSLAASGGMSLEERRRTAGSQTVGVSRRGTRGST